MAKKTAVFGSAAFSCHIPYSLLVGDPIIPKQIVVGYAISASIGAVAGLSYPVSFPLAALYFARRLYES
jgi:hypothetical protein